MNSIRRQVYVIIFGTVTRGGRIFDLVLLVLIVLSLFTVALDSIPSVHQRWGNLLMVIEWVFTGLFTLEYFLRIWAAEKRLSYIASPLGIIDLLAILPAYLNFFAPGMHYLTDIRILRLMRVFRVLKLLKFMKQTTILVSALRSGFTKIAVFISGVLVIIVVFGTLMYVIEGDENGFDSIPRSIYWTIVTITTVGYGDISPKTGLGQLMASLLMLLGYAIIAVPTGIVTMELARRAEEKEIVPNCTRCGSHLTSDYRYCPRCGERTPHDGKTESFNNPLS